MKFKVNLIDNNKIISKALHSKIFLGVIIILFIMSLLLFIKSIYKPLQSEERTLLNNIVQKTNITYGVDALPDGMSDLSNTIFIKVQKNMKVHVASTVTSEKPISIKGEAQVYYDFIAEGLWKQSVLISDKININANGSKNTIIDKDFQINLQDIKDKIEKVENQITGSSAGKYTLKIRPHFQGNILYEGKTIPLDNTYELSFEYSNGVLKLIGTSSEFVKNLPVEELKVVTNNFILLGMSLPLILSRFIFLTLAVIFFILILLYVKSLNFKKNMQPTDLIDKKCGSRLISLMQEPKLQNKILLPLGNFKELIRIADEKDLNILKFSKANSDLCIYMVIDGECIFNYTVSSNEACASSDITSFTIGSDVFNDS